MRKIVLFICLFVLGACDKPANQHRDSSACSGMFFQGVMPSGRDGTFLCNRQYAVLFDTKAAVPVWSAEHLTREEVERAHELKRVNAFHEDSRVSNQPGVQEFFGTGYDRGHLTPNGDMADQQAQEESFLMTNMTAQSEYNNRHPWAHLEMRVRGMARTNGEVFIVTGPIFRGSVAYINRHVPIPTYLFKAVYIPSEGKEFIFVSENTESGTPHLVAPEEFYNLSGLHIFNDRD